MPYITANEIDLRYRALWQAYCDDQISVEAFSKQLAELRRLMRSLGA